MPQTRYIMTCVSYTTNILKTKIFFFLNLTMLAFHNNNFLFFYFLLSPVLLNFSNLLKELVGKRPSELFMYWINRGKLLRTKFV